MGFALKKQPMTADEFLAWDATQFSERYEFVRGEIFMMTGGVDRNYTVALNLAIALRTHLRGTPCRVYGADVKLRVEAADCFFYPDLMVTCSDADAANRLIKREPVLDGLIHSFDDQPDLVQVVIELIEHPALDAPFSETVTNGVRTETSLRAVIYLNRLNSVPAQHRPAFLPLLQKLVQSGKNGESDAAREVLKTWK